MSSPKIAESVCNGTVFPSVDVHHIQEPELGFALEIRVVPNHRQVQLND